MSTFCKGSDIAVKRIMFTREHCSLVSVKYVVPESAFPLEDTLMCCNYNANCFTCNAFILSLNTVPMLIITLRHTGLGSMARPPSGDPSSQLVWPYSIKNNNY